MNQLPELEATTIRALALKAERLNSLPDPNHRMMWILKVLIANEVLTREANHHRAARGLEPLEVEIMEVNT